MPAAWWLAATRRPCKGHSRRAPESVSQRALSTACSLGLFLQDGELSAFRFTRQDAIPARLAESGSLRRGLLQTAPVTGARSTQCRRLWICVPALRFQHWPRPRTTGLHAMSNQQARSQRSPQARQSSCQTPPKYQAAPALQRTAFENPIMRRAATVAAGVL